MISVVIPAYNEERRIPATLRAIHRYLAAASEPFEILVVDDGSRDGTVGVVNRLQAELSQVSLIRLPSNQGKGRAVQEGVLRACGDIILFTDADQSTPIEYLSHLLAPMRQHGCQVAIASRGVAGAQLLKVQSSWRRFLGKAFGALMRTVLITGVQDSQCGFKCFTREAARTIFSSLACANGLFDMEALLLASRHGYRVAEIPVRWVHDPDSRLTYNVWGALGLLQELLRIRRRWGVRWPERVRVLHVTSSHVDFVSTHAEAIFAPVDATRTS